MNLPPAFPKPESQGQLARIWYDHPQTNTDCLGIKSVEKTKLKQQILPGLRYAKKGKPVNQPTKQINNQKKLKRFRHTVKYSSEYYTKMMTYITQNKIFQTKEPVFKTEQFFFLFDK